MDTQIWDPGQADFRFRNQARWSKELREYIFRKLPHRPLNILEVGCGTGVMLDSVGNEFPGRIRFAAGIDINFRMIKHAAQKHCGCLCAGNAETLPFRSDCFDFVFCHYLLMWIEYPVDIIREMRRLTVPGGICAVLAEPCYSEMTAEPQELKNLADVQRNRFLELGANLTCGADLQTYFTRAGFSQVEWNKYRELRQNRNFLETEIEQMMKDTGMDMNVIPNLSERYHYSVPTYYAIAEKQRF